MNYDLRAKDVVRFRKKLTPEQLEKILYFVRSMSNDSLALRKYMANYLDKINAVKPPLFTVVKTSKTRKTQTEFAVVQDTHGYTFSVQSRYFKVIIRQAKHRLTKIFL